MNFRSPRRSITFMRERGDWIVHRLLCGMVLEHVVRKATSSSLPRARP
jgi:hypothetical protein